MNWQSNRWKRHQRDSAPAEYPVFEPLSKRSASAPNCETPHGTPLPTSGAHQPAVDHHGKRVPHEVTPSFEPHHESVVNKHDQQRGRLIRLRAPQTASESKPPSSERGEGTPRSRQESRERALAAASRVNERHSPRPQQTATYRRPRSSPSGDHRVPRRGSPSECLGSPRSRASAMATRRI